jgi:hypothetical protein
MSTDDGASTTGWASTSPLLEGMRVGY